MDTARDVRTLALVEGIELWDLETVERDAYICPGCTTQVFPASFDREHNKKRPYFTLGPSNKHELGCDVDGEEKIIKRAKTKSVGTAEGFPLPFPSRLTLTNERPVQADEASATKLPSSRDTGSKAATDVAGTRKHHGHTVTTIRSACRTFVNFPNDRINLPLEIPGVPGNTYAKVFQYLGSKKPVAFPSPTHLYYAAIRWTHPPVLEQDYCELTLHAGEWDQEKRDLKILSRVRVDWSDWSQARRNSFMREFNTTHEEAREKARANKEVKGWIFFVGTQNQTDPGLFHLDNHRLLCCLGAQIQWPSKK